MGSWQQKKTLPTITTTCHTRNLQTKHNTTSTPRRAPSHARKLVEMAAWHHTQAPAIANPPHGRRQHRVATEEPQRESPWLHSTLCSVPSCHLCLDNSSIATCQCHKTQHQEKQLSISERASETQPSHPRGSHPNNIHNTKSDPNH